jgi:DNA-binding response OmpR family regulator
MATILIAEDNDNIRLLISERLKPFYTILLASDGIEALDILESKHVDLLLTDVMMPGMDGFELIKEIRQNGFKLPALILTAKQSFNDKRIGFSIGTDDYMTKPVNYEELHWRIDALLRRADITNERKIVMGETILDEATYTLSKGTTSIELPKKEFELLYKLLSYPGMIFTKSQLLDDIWGFDSESSEDTVKTHISRIRNRVSDFTEFQIVTVKGLGYKAVIGESHE